MSLTSGQAAGSPPGMMDGPVSGAFLAAGDPDAEKADTLCGQCLPAPLAVVEKGVAAVDDDVAGLQVWQQTFDDQVDHLSGGRHQEYGPWPGERGGQTGKIVAATMVESAGSRATKSSVTLAVRL